VECSDANARIATTICKFIMFARVRWRLLANVRAFTKIQTLEKYALMEHKRNYLIKKGVLLEEDATMKGPSAARGGGKKASESREIVTDSTSVQRELDTQMYPRQHPKNLDYPDTNIISYKPPIRNLAAFNHLPPEARVFTEQPFESPEDSRRIDVCIVGAPNAGKSLLFNKIVGCTVSAVSNKAFTTHGSVMGVYTDTTSNTQHCIYDTPGATMPSTAKSKKQLLTRAWDTIGECDKVIFLVDSVKHLNNTVKAAIYRLRNMTRTVAEQRFIDRLKAMRNDTDVQALPNIKKELQEIGELEDDNEDEAPPVPAILALNKLDLVTSKAQLRTLQRELEDLGQFEKTVFLSAQTGYGIEGLVKHLLETSKRLPWLHNPTTRVPQPEVQKVAEILRQEIYRKYYQDIPHNIDIKVVSWVPRSNGQLIIDFQLDVRTKVQIGILLGQKGRILRDVKEGCQAELCKLLSRPVHIHISIVKNPGTISADYVKSIPEQGN
jgi:GTP-binding protein Era